MAVCVAGAVARPAGGGRNDRDAARVTVGEGQLPSVVHRRREAFDAELVDVLRDAGERRIRRGGDFQRGAGADLHGDEAHSRREGAGADASHHVGGRGQIGLLVVQLDRIDADGDAGDANHAAGAGERRHDRLRGVVAGGSGVDRDPVFAVEHRGIGRVLELLLKFGDFALDLAAIDARRTSGDQLRLDLRDDVDGAAQARIHRVDGRGAEAESVLHGAQSHVVRTHRGGDRPVSGVVRSGRHPIAGVDAVLGGRKTRADRPQSLQSSHGRAVGHQA